MTIQNAWSNVSGSVPPYALADGQIGINQADGVLFSRNADGSTRRTLLPKRYGVADIAFSVRAFDTYVGIASLTASRALVLPPANSYPPGQALAVVDESGAVSPTVTLALTPQGTDKVNGVSSLALTTAFGGVLLFSDGVSKWTAIALPAGGASNALLYVAQSLTGGMQDQARANLSGAMAASQSATTTLTLLDFDRDQFVTGTSTLTMPSGVAPGWRSGVVINDNPVTGLVTLAVPSGHSLDGTTNGSTILFPFQRARLQLISAGVWRTSWVDRAPIVVDGSKGGLITSAVASADFNLPVGYSKFRIEISGLTVSASGSNVGFRISDNGSSGIKSGSSDYVSQNIYGSGAGTAAGNVYTNSFNYLFLALASNSGLPFVGAWTFHPGATGRAATYTGLNYEQTNAPARAVYAFGGDYSGATSGSMGRVNLIRFLADSGLIQAGTAITIIGEP